MNAPQVIKVTPKNIPALLKGTDRWGLWARGDGKPGGRYEKKPIHPETGITTNAHDPRVWRSIGDAVKIYEVGRAGRRQVAGIFFDLPITPEPITKRVDGTPLYLIGLDFDQCVTWQAGEPVISDEVRGVLSALGRPYHELSPSGTGVRVFVTYPKPLKGGNKDHREMYSKGRFLTVTGAGAGEIVEAGPELERLEQKWFGRPGVRQEEQAPAEARNRFAAAVGGFELPRVVGEGERNQTMLAYIGSLRGRGIPEDVLVLAVRQANHDRFSPPLDDDELQGLIDRYAVQATPQSDTSVACASDWPEPKPVEFGLPDVPAFEPDLLPEAFRAFVLDVSERMQCPADLIAAPLVVASAAALGNRVVIAPKAHDTGWLVPTTLWGAVVARPGMMKSPAMGAALAPLRGLEAEMQEENQRKMLVYEAEKSVYDVEKRRWENAIKKDCVAAAGAMPIAPEQPEPERLITNDATVQKLAMLCAASPRGIINVRDELIGWLETLGAEGREADRAFFLEGWNGLSSYTVDRVGRGSDRVDTLNILMLGGIQPGKLQTYVRGATRGGAGDDGLMQRFQVVVWPDHSKEWKNVDRRPDLAAETVVGDVFRKLRAVNPVALGASLPLGGGGPAWLHFTDEAQSLFDRWHEKVERTLRTGDRHPALESHLAKYRSLIPALALLFHLIDGGAGPVTKRALGRAIQWHAYLWKHAKRVYSSAINSGDLSAKSLADKIRAGKLSDGFTVRDVYRNGWMHLAGREDAAEALSILTDHGWVRPYRQDTSGRTTTAYQINSKINKGGT